MDVSVRSGIRSVNESPNHPSIEKALTRSYGLAGARAGCAARPRSPGESGANSSGSIGGVNVREFNPARRTVDRDAIAVTVVPLEHERGDFGEVERARLEPAAVSRVEVLDRF